MGLQLSTQQYGGIVESLKKAAVDSRGSDKRRLHRINVHVPLPTGKLDGKGIEYRYTAMTQDISMGGIGLMQSKAYDAGVELLVELPVRVGVTMLIVSRVMYSRPLASGVYSLGLEFAREADAAMKKAWETTSESELFVTADGARHGIPAGGRH